MEATLKLFNGPAGFINVEMPGATTGRYSVARCVERLGYDPEEVRAMLIAFNGETAGAFFGDDQLAAVWDGMGVALILDTGLLLINPSVDK